MGAIFGDRWIFGKWGRDFIVKEKPSIEFLELFALVAALITWSHLPQLQNTKIAIFCDNKSVRDMVNRLGSSCPQCMKLIRLMCLSNLAANRRVTVKYVKSRLNVLADSLSRLDFPWFWRNVPPTVNQTPDVIPGCMWPVKKIWESSSLTFP